MASPDDVDRRFNDIMREEFQEEPIPFRGATTHEPETLFDAWDAADALDDDARYTPQLSEHALWPPFVVFCAALLCVGVLIWLMALAGMELPSWSRTIASVAAVVGLLGLMLQALRRPARHSDDDHGAVV